MHWTLPGNEMLLQRGGMQEPVTMEESLQERRNTPKQSPNQHFTIFYPRRKHFIQTISHHICFKTPAHIFLSSELHIQVTSHPMSMTHGVGHGAPRWHLLIFLQSAARTDLERKAGVEEIFFLKHLDPQQIGRSRWVEPQSGKWIDT